MRALMLIPKYIRNNDLLLKVSEYKTMTICISCATLQVSREESLFVFGLVEKLRTNDVFIQLQDGNQSIL